MARIPQPRARDFQLERQPPVRGVEPVRTGGLDHLGRTMIARGLELGAEEARQEGMEAQTASDGAALVKRDSSFFGFFDADFDEGARFVFQKQKQQQIDGLIGDVEAANPRNPRAFQEALQERRDEVFEGLPSDVQAGVKLYFDQQAGAAEQRLEQDGIAHEIRVQKSQMLLDVERFGRAAALEVEDTGQVTPETEGTLQALKSRMVEMGFLPQEIDAAEQAIRDDLSVSSLVHQYRNLPADQRGAWARSLLASDGPLGDRSLVERTQIVAKIRSIDDLDKAEARARRSIIMKQANDAIAVEKAGHKHRDTPEVMAGLAALAGGGDADAALKLEELNGAARVRELLETSRTSAEGDVRLLIGTLRQKSAREGLTNAESSLLDGLEDSIAERRKSIGDGSLLDYVERNAIDLSRVGFQGKTRRDQVEFLKAHYGTDNVNYYTGPEFEERADRWKNGSAVEREALLFEIAGEVPPEDMLGVLRRFTRSDKGLPVVLHMVASGEQQRISMAREIMAGTEFMNQNPDVLDKASAIKDDLRGRFARLFAEDATGALVSAYSEAALAVYTSRRRREGSFSRNTTDLNQAVQDVLGGELTSINGHESVPLFQGATQSQSRDMWRAITDDDLRAMSPGIGPLPGALSGLPVDNTVADRLVELDAESIKENGWPIPAPGDGVFYVAMPRAPGTFGPNDPSHYILTDPRSRRPFVFDPGKLLQGPQQRRIGGRAPRRITGPTPAGSSF